MRAITRARAGTHASRFTCAIYRTRKIIVFSLWFYYISRKKKFFIEGFFIEYYTHEIQNVILIIKYFTKNTLLISFLK